MATNEIHKYGHWLTLPVPENKQSGDPVVFAGKPGVVQVIHEEERAPIAGYVALPTQSGFNESGEAIDSALMPDGMVFASVALIGVWAFVLDGEPENVEIGTPVFYNPAGNDGRGSVATSGDAPYGIVTNRGTDGRYHVLLTTDGGAQ